MTDEAILEGLAAIYPGESLGAVERLDAGHEAEIFLFRRRGEARALRLFPDPRSDAKADWEAFVMGRVGEAGFPVPRVHHHRLADDSPWGRPFLVMDLVEGEPLGPAFWGPPSPARDAARATVFGLMARLHALDAERVFRGSPPKPFDPLADAETLLRAGGEAGRALGERVLPALRAALPEAPRLCVLHGDLHANNVLAGVNGPWVIDWPNAKPGDPRQDVAWVRLLARADDDPEQAAADLAAYGNASLEGLGPFEALGALRILAVGLAARHGDDHGLRSEAMGSFEAGSGFGRYLCDVVADRLGVDVSDAIA